jgi:predicted lipoprotein
MKAAPIVAWMPRSGIQERKSKAVTKPGFHYVASGLRMAVISALLVSAPAQADFASVLQRDWLAPRAAEFARSAAALVPAVQAACSTPAGLEPARAAWKESLTAWETLAGVAIGPVLERRSQRAIDFTPTRPRMIEKAIQAAPRTAADMELIGTPAKGLPALEWLLWTRPIAPGTPACAYAVRVAEDIRREADALAAAQPATGDAHVLLTELVNQWVGGIERLRWPGMEMPVRVASTSATLVEPDFPRRASGAVALAWSGQWRALRELALTGEASLAGALRARGQGAQADALAAAVLAADDAMRSLETSDRERIFTAAKLLAALRQRVENEVAPALGVSIGFSDADGD